MFYEENIRENTLTIYADKSGSVSARLIADRFDADTWPNLRPDQDGDTRGTHVISSKPKAGEQAEDKGNVSYVSAVATATSAIAQISSFATSTIEFATSTIQKLLAWLR